MGKINNNDNSSNRASITIYAALDRDSVHYLFKVLNVSINEMPHGIHCPDEETKGLEVK